MKQFNKFFDKTNSEKQEKLSEQKGHQEEWEFYFSNVNDKLGSLFVDLGLHTIAPMADNPQYSLGIYRNE